MLAFSAVPGLVAGVDVAAASAGAAAAGAPAWPAGPAECSTRSARPS